MCHELYCLKPYLRVSLVSLTEPHDSNVHLPAGWCPWHGVHHGEYNCSGVSGRWDQFQHSRVFGGEYSWGSPQNTLNILASVHVFIVEPHELKAILSHRSINNSCRLITKTSWKNSSHFARLNIRYIVIRHFYCTFCVFDVQQDTSRVCIFIYSLILISFLSTIVWFTGQVQNL